MSSPFIIINEIEELLNDMNDGLTSTLSTINTNVNTIKTDVGAVKSATAVNNTASKTGVLSAKSAYIISLLENSTYGLSAIKNAITSNSGCLKSVTKTYTNVGSGNGSSNYSNVESGLTTAQLAGLYSIKVNSLTYASGGVYDYGVMFYVPCYAEANDNEYFSLSVQTTDGYETSVRLKFDAYSCRVNGRVHTPDNASSVSITYYYFE